MTQNNYQTQRAQGITQPEPKVTEKRNPLLNVFLHVDSESAIKKSICQPPLLVIFSKNLKKWVFCPYPYLDVSEMTQIIILKLVFMQKNTIS